MIPSSQALWKRTHGVYCAQFHWEQISTLLNLVSLLTLLLSHWRVFATGHAVTSEGELTLAFPDGSGGK